MSRTKAEFSAVFRSFNLKAVYLGLLIIFVSLWPTVRLVQAEDSVVHAVLFFSRTCPHCHKVMTEDLPPLVEQYGEHLSILGIDTASQAGRDLYLTATEYYQIPPEQQGVPLLIVGETILMGSLDIPQQFPGIIEEGLAAGGIAWPTFPGLQEVLEVEGLLQAESLDALPPKTEIQVEPIPEAPVVAPTAESVPLLDLLSTRTAENTEEALIPDNPERGVTANLEEAALASENMTLAERFAQDKAGNTLSVIVLLGMVLVVLRVGYLLTHPTKNLHSWPNWIVPVLALLGTAVALYMGYVEISQTEAVCGPVGNCNTVQQSPYATLFGLIPIGVLGVFGYVVIGVTWLIAIYGPENWQHGSTVMMRLLAFIGILFSIYLTFLEPFVIGASCVWCLSSAVVMALLFWVVTLPTERRGRLPLHASG